jgi:hypothetical protein
MGKEPGGSTQLRVTERFSLLAPETMLYEYTVDDPVTYTRPWTAHLTMKKQSGPVLEYGCHEGNHSLEIALAAARTRDAEAATLKEGSK